MDEDSEREFAAAIMTNFSNMEGQMGQDAYRAFVANTESMREQITASTERVKAITASIRIFTLVAFIMAIPVVVALWRWAVS